MDRIQSTNRPVRGPTLRRCQRTHHPNLFGLVGRGQNASRRPYRRQHRPGRSSRTNHTPRPTLSPRNDALTRSADRPRKLTLGSRSARTPPTQGRSECHPLKNGDSKPPESKERSTTSRAKQHCTHPTPDATTETPGSTAGTPHTQPNTTINNERLSSVSHLHRPPHPPMAMQRPQFPRRKTRRHSMGKSHNRSWRTTSSSSSIPTTRNTTTHTHHRNTIPPRTRQRLPRLPTRDTRITITKGCIPWPSQPATRCNLTSLTSAQTKEVQPA